MLNALTYTLAPLVCAVLAGPVAFVSTNMGALDDMNLYLVIDPPFARSSDKDLYEFGASVVGPTTAPAATFVHASPAVQQHLVLAGYWIVPAARLAEICGIGTDPATL